MSNINVRKRVEKLSDELDAVVHHVKLYGGISKEHARFIDNVATSMAEQAAALAGYAREIEGNRSGASLPKKVRKALGFTVP